MERIFISYKRANKELVFTLVEELEKRLGVKCWVDMDGIESSAQFASKICNAIDNAAVVLFMHSYVHLSIDFEKDWTIKELNYAQMKNKRVVLVKLDNSPLDNIFLMEYGTKNNIDSTDPQQLDKLINDLSAWLELSQADSESNIASNSISLKILSNVDCKVIIDSEEMGTALANCMIKIPLSVGEYFVEFVSIQNPSCAISKEITLTHDKIEKVDLLSVEQNKEAIVNQKFENIDEPKDTNIVKQATENAIDTLQPKYKIHKDGKWGYEDEHGKEIICCKYDDISYFCNGFAKAYIKGQGWGYINKTGKEITPFKYKFAYDFNNGFARVSVNNKFGYINKDGKEIISCRYDDIYDFHDGLARIRLNNKFGYINYKNEEVISCKYDSATDFNNKRAKIKIGGKLGLINIHGDEIVAPKYDKILDFKEGIAVVILNYNRGYINEQGEEIVSCKYNDGDDFSDGLARVKMNGKYGYIDKSGKEVIPCKYDLIRDFSGDWARAYIKGQGWGYVNKTGKEIF